MNKLLNYLDGDPGTVTEAGAVFGTDIFVLDSKANYIPSNTQLIPQPLRTFQNSCPLP